MPNFSKRIRHLNLAFFIVFTGILARLFWVGIYEHSLFTTRAEAQQTSKQTIKAERGEILIHEKDQIFPIATTKEEWILAIDPRIIKEPESTYNDLKNLVSIQMPLEEFIAKASKKTDPYEIVEKRLSLDDKKKVQGANLEGVVFTEADARFYPGGNFASHVLGFVGADEIGKYGLERLYQDELAGKDGILMGEESLGGRLLLFGKTIENPVVNGSTLETTLDAGVERYLEKSILDVRARYSAESAGGIVINPQTGEILAMASTPSFDPNAYGREKSIEVFKNPNTENLFEMGSVIKPLTMAAAIDSGAVTPETTYVDTGTREIDGRTISNFDGKARGRVPMQEILSQSLNLGATFLMEQIGKDRFREYMHNYGLSEKTKIELPNEAVGNLKNLESTRLIEYATAAFGQGISMTPIEFVRAMSSLANGGLLINPYIIHEIRRFNGEVIAHSSREPKRVLKEETSKKVTQMLVRVVDEKLANGNGKIPGYSVAAKTGTAQIASRDRRGYSEEFLHTFFGYGPAYNPRFLVFYYLEKPQGIRYASESLTETFRSTMKFLFSYYEVPPDRMQEVVPQ